VVWPDAEFPADPYPGAVPPGSFAHAEELAREIDADGRVAGLALDDWLAERDAAPCAQRVPVLAYGSNKCPSKITWLRRQLGLGEDPVVVLRARTSGLAAVWAAGLRHRDGQRPAVLAAAPGVEETHAVWLATPEQVAVLDRCEGRDERFRLARLRTGRVTLDAGPGRTGAVVDRPWCYLGHAAVRRPLLVDGTPVRCADVPQADAAHLDGTPGSGDGLDGDVVAGAPHPDEWPAALFTYGLLQPGQPSWALVAPHAAGTAAGRPTGRAGARHRARLPGVAARAPRHDAGVGRTAARPGRAAAPPGRLRGPRLPRVRVAPDDGTVCWAYAWRSAADGFAHLADGWPARR
jgi:hypothetical protein